MEHARPPAVLTLEGGPAARADAWRKWLSQFQIFLKASGVHTEKSDVQACLLLNLIGQDGYDVYSTFHFTKEENKEDVTVLINKFNGHFETKTSVTLLRFKFFTRNQEQGESIDEYVTALKLLSRQCQFEHLEDGLVRDRIVCGVRDTTVRDRLLRTEDLTLQKSVKICQTFEISNNDNKQIEVASSSSRRVSVDAVWSGGGEGAGRAGGRGGPARRASGGGGGAGYGRGPARGGGGGGPGYRRAATSSWVTPASVNPGTRACAACGEVNCDGRIQCIASKVKCFLCNGKGHFKKMCPVKKQYNRVYELSEDCQEQEFYYISSIDSIDGQSSSRDKWYETLYLCTDISIKIVFKLDSGSDLNVICKQTFLSLGFSLPDLTQDNTKAKSFCGTFLPVLGSCVINLLYKNKEYKLKFIVTEHECQSILGKHALEQLNLIKRIYSINIQEYDDLFNGLGKLPGLYKIPIDSNISPTICPVRKIPLGVRDKLQRELNRMEELGVIKKVSHPTTWVNGIVIVAKKDGNLRVCLDPRPLNRAIRRQHYPLPTVTEMAANLNGARYFSKLDARSGFWMVQLDEDSADLCTFGTPFGRYQYLRLPYGINSASEIFHAKVRQLLEDLEGVDSFVDDVICWGSTREEHDERLRALMQRAREVGIKFNREKCMFCVTEVTYLGHTFSANGMKVDSTKVQAINDMPSPSDRQSLERFLGMVNYVSKFIPNYSDLASPLRALLKKGNEWCWSEREDAAVAELKRALCDAPVLRLFCAREPCVVSVDASGRAVGAVLLQGGRPVEFASATLTDTQQRYAQIEKEMLAIVFALERFHQYIFGKIDVTVETDHKPLEALFKKSLDSVPARLQRMMLRVQRYDVSVRYVSGKYMYIADTLSRSPLPTIMQEKVSNEVDEQTCYALENVPFSDSKLQLVAEHTKNDRECQVIIGYITGGWPSNKYEVDENARQHWSHRECFEYIKGIIFKDNLVFIPTGLRSEMISRVHEGHLGIDRCKRRARDVMFWAGMSRDVEAAVRRFRLCAELAPRPPREPLMPHHIPSTPWTKVASDIFEHDKKYFLILADYFSNFIEVSPLNNINSRSVILAMCDQFARHGIPRELITDNGPAYASKEFRLFSEKWGFKHTTSSPHFPQSNGKSERAVRTIKTLLVKSKSDDFYLGLLNYRTTPRDGIASPAELIMGRRLNTRLPLHSFKLQPARDNTKDYAMMMRNQGKSAVWYNERARALPELQPGDEVMLEGGGGEARARRGGRVLGRAPQPRSYYVTDHSDKISIENTNRELQKSVTTQQDEELSKKIKISWESKLPDLKEYREQILPLLRNAAKENHFYSVEEYWNLLGEYEGGLLKARELWEQVRPLYVKLQKYVTLKLRGPDYVGQPLPGHILKSLSGDDWSNLIESLLPKNPDIYQKLHANLQLKNLGGSEVFKVAAQLLKDMGFHPIEAQIWSDSVFNGTCPTTVVDGCKHNKIRVFTCKDIGITKYMAAHEDIMRIKYKEIAAIHSNNTYILREANRYSALYEAIPGFASLLSLTPHALDRNGLYPLERFNYRNNANHHRLVLQLILALQDLPRLNFYLAADEWRINALKNPVTSPEVANTWSEFRRNFSMIDTSDKDLLGDNFVLLNKPFIGKFLGVILKYQIYQTFAEELMSDDADLIQHVSEDNSRLIDTMSKGYGVVWPEMVSDLLAKREFGLEFTGITDYFRLLDEYLDNQLDPSMDIIAMEYEEPPEPSPIDNEIPQNTKETLLEEIERTHENILDNAVDVGDETVMKQRAETSTIGVLEIKNPVPSNEEKNDQELTKEASYNTYWWLAVIVAIAIAAVLIAVIAKKRHNHRKNLERQRRDERA